MLDSTKQDADVLIVQTTVASVQTKHTILVGDDTDFFVLLHHADIDANNVFLSPENTQTSKVVPLPLYSRKYALMAAQRVMQNPLQGLLNALKHKDN